MKKQMVRNTLIGRLFLIYLMLFAASMIAVSTISYYYNSSNSIRQVSQTYEKLLLQTDYNINSIYERAFQIGAQLLDNPDIIVGLYGENLSTKDETRPVPAMLRVVYTDSTYNSIYLYNGKTKSFLHTIPRNIDVPEIDKDIYKVMEESRKMYKNILLPHIQSYEYNGDQYTDYLLSLVFRYSGPDDKSAIFVNLGKNTILNLFSSMKNTQNSDFIIVDKKAG